MKEFLHKMHFDLLHYNNPILFVHQKSYSKPEDFHLHINHYYEIYIYISGDVDYIVDDKYYTLNKGDIITISPYKVHKAVLKSECMYERFYFLIPVDSFDKFIINPMAAMQNHSLSSGYLLNASAEEKQRLMDILYKISRCSTSPSDTQQVMVYGLFLQFISILDTEISKANPSLAYSFPNNVPSVLSNILFHIEKNLSSISSIGQLAEQFNLSLPYFSTLFKNSIGISAKGYIQAKKIALAKKLLDEGNSIADTCYEIGYNDCSYFIKIFKEHMGITPHQYQIQISSGKIAMNKQNQM